MASYIFSGIYPFLSHIFNDKLRRRRKSISQVWAAYHYFPVPIHGFIVDGLPDHA